MRKGADRRRGLEASCFQLLASMTKGSDDSKVTGPAVGANSWHRCSDTVMFPTGHEATGSAVAGLRKRQASIALVCRGIWRVCSLSQPLRPTYLFKAAGMQRTICDRVVVCAQLVTRG